MIARKSLYDPIEAWSVNLDKTIERFWITGSGSTLQLSFIAFRSPTY
jgi:hypothetical protein